MGVIKIDLKDLSDVRQIGALIRESVEKKRREIGLTFLQQVSVINPVNTGRLRVGWMPSLNIPSDFLPEPGIYSFPDIMGRAQAAWANSTMDDVLMVTNNVPYAAMVNNGTVKMAPRRFIERTITVINNAYSG
jgi:hypothetical protein